jgi:hypothetical protein
VPSRNKELVDLIGKRVCRRSQNTQERPLSLSPKSGPHWKTAMKEESKDSVFGQMGELAAPGVNRVERSRREAEMNKSKCSRQEPLRGTLSKGCRGKIKNQRSPD